MQQASLELLPLLARGRPAAFMAYHPKGGASFGSRVFDYLIKCIQKDRERIRALVTFGELTGAVKDDAAARVGVSRSATASSAAMVSDSRPTAARAASTGRQGGSLGVVMGFGATVCHFVVQGVCGGWGVGGICFDRDPVCSTVFTLPSRLTAHQQVPVVFTAMRGILTTKKDKGSKGAKRDDVITAVCSCVSDLAKSLGPHIETDLSMAPTKAGKGPSFVDLLFAQPLSQPLLDALQSIAEHVPNLARSIRR